MAQGLVALQVDTYLKQAQTKIGIWKFIHTSSVGETHV